MTEPEGFKCCLTSDYLELDYENGKRYNVTNFVTKIKTLKLFQCVLYKWRLKIQRNFIFLV